MFDVPELKTKVRDTFRMHLKNLEFHEFQKSVFVFPYPAGREIEFLIEFYNSRRYVRQMVATKIDNELHLKKIFRLL